MKRMNEGREDDKGWRDRRTVGALARHPDGSFVGVLRTVLIRTQLELRPIRPAVRQLRYTVYANADFLFGTAMQKADTLTLRLAAPELCSPLLLLAVPMGGDDFNLVWDLPSPGRMTSSDH